MSETPLHSTAAPLAVAGDPQRIDWLFRDALRRREINPLMRLMQLHREPNRALAPDTDRPPAETQT